MRAIRDQSINVDAASNHSSDFCRINEENKNSMNLNIPADHINKPDNRLSLLSASGAPVPINGVGECKICFLEKYINNTLVPCGHNGYCMDCLADIKKSDNPICPLCRTQITDVVKVFDQLKSDEVHLAKIKKLKEEKEKL